MSKKYDFLKTGSNTKTSGVYYRFDYKKSVDNSFFFDENALELHYDDGNVYHMNWMRYEKKFFKVGNYMISLFRGDSADHFGYSYYLYKTIKKDDHFKVEFEMGQGITDIGFINYILYKLNAKALQANQYELGFAKFKKTILFYDNSQISIF